MMEDYKALFSDVFGKMNIPVVIGSFGDGEIVSFPFIEYHRDAPDYLIGDNKVLQKTDRWDISLYNLKEDAPKHWELCDKLEGLLDEHNVSYDNSGDIFIDDENIIYTTITLSIIK